MSFYPIKFSPTENMMRVAIDSAVHQAVGRFCDELGEHQGLAYSIARAAAESAVEQFKTLCNAELRLIEIDHQKRMNHAVHKASSMLDFQGFNQ